MKQVNGFWLPDGEQHLVQFLETGPQFAGGPTYQLHKLLAALPYVKNFRHAVDAGAHCGLWARPMAAMFGHVTAFEPVVPHRECLERNIQLFALSSKITVIAAALGDKLGSVTLHTGPSSSGDTYVKDGGEHSAPMYRLDEIHLPAIDFMKIDCEGFEKFVLQGAEQTVRRDRPCIVVEQKPKKGSQFGIGDTDAVVLLKSWGAKQRAEISGDFIMSWD